MSHRHKPHEVVYAVVRYDFDLGEPEHRITVKEIVRGHEFALAEVERLNRVNADKPCRYFCQMTRLFPPGASAGSCEEAPQSLLRNNLTRPPAG
jgi:hypothetical protein